jgi:hypothetical protein
MGSSGGGPRATAAAASRINPCDKGWADDVVGDAAGVVVVVVRRLRPGAAVVEQGSLLPMFVSSPFVGAIASPKKNLSLTIRMERD